jgi:hypothetical protein
MSDTKEKVFNLILEASYAKRGVLFDQCKLRDIPDIVHDAMVYSIEQHEALKQQFKTTKQEYSDFRQKVSNAIENADLLDLHGTEGAYKKLHRFIIPAPTPDPLVEVLGDLEWNNNSPECAAELRAALDARGLEIKRRYMA